MYVSMALHFQKGAADRILTVGQGSNGFIELMQKTFCEFNFGTDWDLELNIKKRGVENLPKYHSRDDSLLIWKAIKEHVCDIVNLFYSSDEEVQEDIEIQEWFDEIYRYVH